MLHGIISDIHSNLSALQAVLQRLEELEVDSIMCLGDIVGYAARPVECIELVRERAEIVVMGNHDAGTTGDTTIHNFNSMAREAILWTRETLGPGEMEFLRKLPLMYESESFILVHSSPVSPDRWHYIFSSEQAWQVFDSCSYNVVFVGHTHRPVLFCIKDGELAVHTADTYRFEEGVRYIINVGSVGQPRDGDPRASFVTFDSGDRTVEFHRTPYDIRQTQDTILEAELPVELARRLSQGY